MCPLKIWVGKLFMLHVSNRSDIMKKIISIILLSVIIISIAGGCYNAAYGIEAGKYVCETPYMTITYGLHLFPYDKDYLEINQKVYEVFSNPGWDGQVLFYLYEEKYISSPDMPFMGDMENTLLARYRFKYDKKNKEFIVTTQEKNGNVYHLKKVE